MVVVEVDQGGERRGMRTHCRHCAHSPARPLAGSMSTAAAVQQQQRPQQQQQQQQRAGRDDSELVKQLADRLPCALSQPARGPSQGTRRASGPAGGSD